MANARQIDKRFLAGLTYRYAERTEKDNGDGGRTVHNVPKERDLTPDDVLDWKDNGPSVTIVTADGQKVTVEKKAKE